jgi:hypothetical protein
VSSSSDDRDQVRSFRRNRFRSPASLIDWLVIALGLVAFVAGLLALFASWYASDRSTSLARDDHAHELNSWQLAALLVAFAGLVATSLAGARRVRQMASVLTLAIALAGFVAWWWTATDELLGQRFLDTGHLALGGGIVFTGIALGLQIVVGVLMFMAAFPLDAYASARRPA